MLQSGDRQTLVVPSLSEVRYFLRAGSSSQLMIEDLAAVDAAPEEIFLEILIDRDGHSQRVLEVTPRKGPRPIRVDLGLDGDDTVRITLRARNPAGGWPRAGSLELVRPMVTVPSDSRPVTRPEVDENRTVLKRPNVLIYLVDTLRADHLGCYGYPDSMSPSIDAFAGDATLFLRFHAQSSWTKPTVASLFTGLSPSHHGVESTDDALPEEAVTLAGLLRNHGYDTAAFTTNPIAGREFGFDQGFRHFEHVSKSPEGEAAGSQRLCDRAVAWLREREPGQPFFLYLHAMDPHGPYHPAESYRREHAPEVGAEVGSTQMLRELTHGEREVSESLPAQLALLYDGEIASCDAVFGRLVSELQRADLYEAALLVFLADHGEEFFDHGGWIHGHTLFEEQLHVPLIVRFTGGRWKGVEVEAPVQQIDLLPTVLDVLGELDEESWPGKSLLRLMSGQDAVSWSERPRYSVLKKEWLHMESLTAGHFKLISVAGACDWPRVQLFDLATDPQEEANLADQRPILAGYLYSKLKQVRQQGSEKHGLEPEAVKLSEEMKEQLRALGYID